RALRYGRPLSVLAVELAARDVVDRGRVALATEGVLRLPDVVAVAGGNELLVLLPETPARHAHAPAERLLRALAPLARRIRGGVASYPEDGCDADALLAGARSAARVAAPGEVASPADAATGIRLGDRNLIAADAATNHLLVLLERVAGTDLPLLLVGERGA